MLDTLKIMLNEKRTFHRIKNPLKGHKLKSQDYTSIEIIERFFWNNYSKFEDCMEDTNKQEFKYLISILTVLMSEDLIFKFSKSKTWIKNQETDDAEKFKIETLTMHPADDMLIENINNLIGFQTVYFTDATMPNFRINKINIKIQNVMFGDPLSTNEKLLVLQNNTLYKFDNTRWHRGGKDYREGKGYKRRVIDELMTVINRLENNNIAIWAPNKEVAKEIILLLNKEIENLACDPSHVDSNCRVLVNWVRSSESRGVDSKRRVHIMLGNPEVPRNAYDYLAFMYPDYFDLVNDEELEKIASEHKTTLQRVKEIIGGFHIPFTIGKTKYRKETANKIESALFDLISKHLRLQFVAADGWQPGSRAKDPKATTPSVLYLLGWDAIDAYNMTQWGYDLNIVNGVKCITDNSTVIAPPKMNVGGISEIEQHLSGFPHPLPLRLPISKDFSELENAIYFASNSLGRNPLSKEIWQLVGDTAEDHRNGFFVARNRLLGTAIETLPREFEYSFEPNTGIDIPQKELIIKVLRSALRLNNEDVKVREIVNNNRYDGEINVDSVNKILNLIDKQNLLEGSSWTIEKYKSKGKTYRKITKNSVFPNRTDSV